MGWLAAQLGQQKTADPETLPRVVSAPRSNIADRRIRRVATTLPYSVLRKDRALGTRNSTPGYSDHIFVLHTQQAHDGRWVSLLTTGKQSKPCLFNRVSTSPRTQMHDQIPTN
ncbi:hypothetical protein CPAR01_13444 [Colletotrichum paranaense]|uniref:Uncharacterized protein n=1 Tax=Colletotrichum paranaense TaxID=1914294 RepID=A0ABQ9S631_9PEZI|nr:uncharacterized protein CPAR01_13444 [Colletotrichum paranaense]KAK1526916.1 hypothetical protein CPAR01_13444 [Colletotrichum paranaense]